MNTKEKARVEACQILFNTLENLIKIADKYKYDRDKFLNVCAKIFYRTIDTVPFKNYEGIDDRQDN